MLAVVAGEHRPGGDVRAKIVDVVDRQQTRETGARTIDAALDGADRAAANLGGFLVGEAGRADQDEGLALVVGELGERLMEFPELDAAGLLGLRLPGLGLVSFGV